ncbi:hypothetical protein FRC04_004377 [Tulasnella sp. 424]|nr:hypothetical protein FRC04_004377 [Tulasnella sp. 424]KAG8979488.1 hypothetical protein FRC05_008477 [Tulasnella sp. 425]
MALVTISGYPASGKTYRAEQLRTYLEGRFSAADYDGPRLKVVVISDDSLSVDRSSYDDSRSEKPARGAAFTALTRNLGKDTIVIMDGMNYIKGFRYQMHCAGREAQVRMCTIYVASPPDECRKRHEAKENDKKYKPATFDNLLMRFEEPNSMARWDSPLFTVSSTDEMPLEALWTTIMTGAKAPTNVAVVQNAKPPTDALQILESTATTVVSLLSSSPAVTSGTGGRAPLSVSSTRLEIDLPPRSITLSELQRHKRQFVAVHRKALSQGAQGSLDWNEETVARKFVDYLESHLNT